jgi:hypothetical protein
MPKRSSMPLTFGILMALTCEATLAASPGIRSVDWGNFHYNKSPATLVAPHDQPIVLRNGRSRASAPGDFEISHLASVRYDDFLGDGRTEAAVEVVTPVAAHRGEEDNIYVFEWRGGRPHQIFFHMYESGARIQVEGRSLVILERDGSPPDRIHQSEAILCWRGGAFRTVFSGHIPATRP